MRKTIAIKALLKTINFNLQRMDKHATIDYKRAMCDAIESALFATLIHWVITAVNTSDINCP